MRAFRASEIIGWLGLVAGFLILFRLGRTSGPWPVAAGAAVLAATAMLVFWRSLAALSRLQKLLIEGRPKPMLRLIRRRLRYRGGGNDRAPLLIYQAAAFSMIGEFGKGLAALDSLEVPGDLPLAERASWAFSYAATRFGCLLFAERIEEARALFDADLAALKTKPTLATAISAMAAQLHYCEGEHIRAERIFEKVTDDAAVAPAAKAVFHYFLGRIYRDRGQRDRSDEQFAAARRLAPRTWIPAGIDAL